jgi:hypothetical protein
MAIPIQKAKSVLWFNTTKSLKRVQCRYRGHMELTHLPSHPFMDFTKCCEIGCIKGKFLLLKNVWMKLEYQLDVYRVTNMEHL